MTLTVRARAAAAVLTSVVLATTTLTSWADAAPRTSGRTAAPASPTPALRSVARSAGDNLALRLSLTSTGDVRVSWTRPVAASKLRRWVIRTSTSLSMKPDLKTYGARAAAQSIVVPHARLVVPASGDGTFVKIMVIRKSGRHGSSPTKWIKAPTVRVSAATSAVTMATFNVRSWNLESGLADGYLWRNRRSDVYDSITRSGAGVVALQEASGSKDNGHGPLRQCQEIAANLPSRWRLTNEDLYRPSAYASPYGRQGTRILYDSSLYTLVKTGTREIAGQGGKGGTTWTPWALLEEKATGIRFHVVSIHLETGSTRADYDTRLNQADAVIDLVDNLSQDGNQVFVAGDTNSTVFTLPNNGVHRAFMRAHFYDAFASATVTHGDYPTTNNFTFPVKTSRHRRDDILSFGPLRGSYWYTNMAYTSRAAAVSDHFMQVARMPIGVPRSS
jgi:endonuclease/exonuclease/phosphatase family metal-dependent hydrolase